MDFKIPTDPFILELLPEFVDQWISDLDELFLKHVDEKNADELYRLAHTLKGSCFQFGIDEMAEMGIKIMALTKAGDFDSARSFYEPLKNGFIEVKRIIEST